MSKIGTSTRLIYDSEPPGVGPSLAHNRSGTISVYVPLAGILLLSAVVLLYQLDAKSLWIDEIWTISTVNKPSFIEFLSAQMALERQPPLYWLPLFLIAKTTGQTSDLLMRLPAALAGIASVFSLFLLGRALGGARLGLVAALLLALSPMFVLYSRMARYYSFSVLFAIISCFFFVKWLQNGEDGVISGKLVPVGYVFSTLLMLFSAYPTVTVIACQNLGILILVLKKRTSLTSWLLAQLIILAVFGAWILYAYPFMLKFRIDSTPFALGGITKILLTALYPFYSYSVGETIFPWNLVALLGLLLTAILGILVLRKVKTAPSIRFASFMFFGTWVGINLIFVFVIVDVPFITAASRSIFSLPFFLLLLASGVLSLKRKGVILLFGSSLLAVYVFSLSNYFTNQQFHNPIYAVPTKEIVANILTQASPDDVVIYDWDIGVELYWPADREKPLHFISYETDRIEAHLRETNKPRVWLITFGRDRTKESRPQDLLDWLDQNYNSKLQQGFVRQDPIYREVKRRILGYEDYEYKVMVDIYTNN